MTVFITLSAICKELKFARHLVVVQSSLSVLTLPLSWFYRCSLEEGFEVEPGRHMDSTHHQYKISVVIVVYGLYSLNMV